MSQIRMNKPISFKLCFLYSMLCFTIVANVSMLVFYFNTTSLAYFNSDAASNLILADEMLKSSELIVSDWIYNNKDVFIFNYQLIATGFLKIFGLGYIAHVYASAVFAFLLLALLFAVVWGLSHSLLVGFIVVAIFSSGISSPFIAQLLFDWGGAYGSWFILTLVAWAALLAIHKCSCKPVSGNFYLYSSILGVAVLVASVSNTSKALLYVVAPAFILEVLNMWMCKDKRNILRCTFAIFLIAVAFYMGWSINSLANSSDSILTNPRVYDQSTLVGHLGNIFNGYLYLFGYPTIAAAQPNLLISGAEGVKSFDGLYLFCRSVLSISFIGLPVLYALEVKRYWKLNVLLLFPAISFILALSVHIVLFRYPNNSDPGSIRYIFVPLMLIFVSLLSLRGRQIHSFVLRHPVCSILFSITLVLISYMNYVRPAHLNSGISSAPIELSKCLERNGVHYGYADFWSASSVTVLTGSKVTVRPIVFSGNKIEKMPFLVSKKWYSSDGHTEFFVIFPDQYLAQITDGGDLIAKSSRNFACQSNVVYVFDWSKINIFDNSLIKIKLPIDLNRNLVDYETNELIKFNGSGAGYVVYGNYVTAEKGRYRLSYFAKGEKGASLSCGYVDIVSDLGTKVFGKYEFNKVRTSNVVEIPNDTSSLEFRVYSTGECPLTVSKKIELIRLD